MIYIRDDDVLLPSSSYESPFGRFKQIHEWIEKDNRFIHKPAILVSEIQGFPECIEYIKDKIKNTEQMEPEIHGLHHIDYGKLTKEQVKGDLKYCQDWFDLHLGWKAVKFYTPWGASQPHLHEAAAELNLELVDTSKINKLEGRYGVVQRLKEGSSNFLEGQEIFMHWWSGGSRLLRVIETVKHGSWEAAAKANVELFKE
jgi:hypothetical protein